MEYIIMIVSHILKSAEFFIIEGFPEITFENLPDVIVSSLSNIMKLVIVYLSLF